MRVERETLWRYRKKGYPWGSWQTDRIESLPPSYESEPRTFIDAESLTEELDRRAEEAVEQMNLAKKDSPWRTAYAHREDAYRDAARLVREGE